MTTLTRNMPGHVDENGVLWHNASVGKFVSIAPGMETLWSCIKGAAEKHATRNAVGERAVVHRQMVNGMEKVVMGTYSYTTYAQYMTRINNLGSGLATLPELSKGSTVIIYADTQLLWMLSAFAAWRQGLIVGTIYATLGEDGAEFGINQSGCSMIFADGKLLKILGKIATKIPKCKRVVVFKPEDMDGDSVAKLKAAEIEVTPLPGLEAAGAEKPAKETPSSAEETAVRIREPHTQCPAAHCIECSVPTDSCRTRRACAAGADVYVWHDGQPEGRADHARKHRLARGRDA